MTTEVTEAALIAFIQNQIFHDASNVQVDPDRPLLEDGLLDSIGLQQLVTFIEHEWGLRLEDEHLTLENFSTAKAIVALVRGILGNGENDVRTQ